MRRKNSSKLVVAGVCTAIFGAVYAAIVRPVMHANEYSNRQAEFLKAEGKSKDEILPVGLPAWRDPFEEKQAKR
eukprot:m.61407 g.61407  ORF g.61407 m.61407 type:complete len:74 (+) comp11408_c0_seq1:348-569(+)